MTDDDQAAPAASAAVRSILHAIRRELDSLAHTADLIQADVSRLALTWAFDEDSMRSLQGLDRLTQELQGVATFVQTLAPSIPAHWTGDARAASAAVTLSELSRRLANPDGEAASTEPCDAGSLDLFEDDLV